MLSLLDSVIVYDVLSIICLQSFDREGRGDCFALILLLVSFECCVALSSGDTVSSAIFN